MTELGEQAPEAVSGLDAAFLRMDTPDTWAIINMLFVLAEPVGIDELYHFLETRLLPFPRFRFSVVDDDGRLRWARVDDLDITRHVRVHHLDGGGKDALCRWLGDALAQPLSPGRPGWELVWIPDYGPGGALLMRVHHVYGDGRSMARVLAALGGVAAPPKGGADGGALFQNGPTFVRRKPTAAATSGGDFLRKRWSDVKTLAKLITLRKDQGTGFAERPGLRRRIAFSAPITESSLRQAAERLQCRPHELVLTALSGALRARYLRDGVDPGQIRYKVSIAVDLHARTSIRGIERHGHLRNIFGSVLLELPLGTAGPAARAAIIRRLLRTALNSNEAHMTYEAMCRFETEPPETVRKLLRADDPLASGIVSTLVGPGATANVAGRRVEQAVFWAPTPRLPGTALGVGVLSYAGQAQFGVTVAENAPFDAQTVVDDLEAEIRALTAGGD